MKTKSEEEFETFLKSNNLAFEKIEEADSPRPDYVVTFNDFKLIFEIKELQQDENFTVTASNRKVGQHIRDRINDSKKQIQWGNKQGIPSILLIYNNLDPFHMFGTENHDFKYVMDGDYTIDINLNTNKASNGYYGKNKALQHNKNTSFSALGRLKPYNAEMVVTLFHNSHAALLIPYDKLPKCFKLAL